MIIAFVLFLMTCPFHAQHVGVDARHDTFGMSHETTRHAFKLLADGGAIELRTTASDPDTTKVIQAHLRAVAADFARGDFSKPLFVHGTTPDGVPPIKALHDAIRYDFESLPDGGRIRITAKGAAAVGAVHDFLRFQLREHHGATEQ